MMHIVASISILSVVVLFSPGSHLVGDFRPAMAEIELKSEPGGRLDHLRAACKDLLLSL